MFGIVSFIGWLIVGAIIGWIAGKVWVGHGFGTLGNIVVGIVGSMIGVIVVSMFLPIIDLSTNVH